MAAEIRAEILRKLYVVYINFLGPFWQNAGTFMCTCIQHFVS